MESIKSSNALMSIYLSSYTTDSSHYDQVKNKFMTSLQSNLPSVVAEYRNCSNELERIACLQKHFEWISIPQLFFKKWQKCAESSQYFREMGDKDYKLDQISSALRCYNLALCFAMTNSAEEGIAYYKRSELFTEIKEFGLAIRDIGIILDGDFDFRNVLEAEIISKAEVRRNKCEKLLRQNMANIFQSKRKSEQGVNYCKDKLSRVETANQVLIGAANCVEMKCDPIKGRYLAATKDIECGTVILKDAMYASVLDKILLWDTEHCATCTIPILGGIPDPESSFPMYCSKKCHSNRKPLPDSLLTYIHLCPVLRDCLLPLIVALTAPSTPTITSKSSIPGINSPYDPSNYESVFNLVPHRGPTITDKKSSGTTPTEFNAIFISYLVRELLPNVQESFCPAIFLRHMESIPYNAITLCSWYSEGIGSFSLPYFASLAKSRNAPLSNVAYATGIFNLVALANNSCDPNAVLLKNCRIPSAFMLSTKKIVKGAEVCMSYKGHWSKIEVDERRRYLKESYHFDCTCIACEGKWGPDDLEDEADTTTPQEEAVLEEVELKLEEGLQLIREENYGDALDVITTCINDLSWTYTRYQMGVVAQDLMRRVIVQLSML